MSDMKIGVALAQLGQAELAVVFWKQLGGVGLRVPGRAEMLASAVIQSSREEELRAWVRHFVESRVESGGRLEDVLRIVASEAGGGNEAVAGRESRMLDAAGNVWGVITSTT
jgi:hypothetical protein